MGAVFCEKEGLTVDLLGVAGERGLDAARAMVKEHHHPVRARRGDQALAARRGIDGQDAALQCTAARRAERVPLHSLKCWKGCERHHPTVCPGECNDGLLLGC